LKWYVRRKEKRLESVYKDCFCDIEVVKGVGGIKKVENKE
jgi:hypothetical protein